MKDLVNVKPDHYVGKRYQMSMNIANSAYSYTGEVEESFENLCLVRQHKAFINGQFYDYAICRVGYHTERSGTQADQIEVLNEVMIDYNTNPKADSPPVYAAPEKVVRERYLTMVEKMQLEKSEAMLREDKALRAEQERKAIEQRKNESIAYMNNRAEVLRGEVIQALREKPVEKLLRDKDYCQKLVELKHISTIQQLINSVQ